MNQGRHEHEHFDFLGYTFQMRAVRSKDGRYFNGFTPAVSKAAAKEFRGKMREIRREGILLTPEALARKINPIIRGWANYFTRYNPSEARLKGLNPVNLMLVCWAKRKYKKLRYSRKAAFHWVAQLAKREPNLFYQWQLGYRLAMR